MNIMIENDNGTYKLYLCDDIVERADYGLGFMLRWSLERVKDYCDTRGWSYSWLQ